MKRTINFFMRLVCFCCIIAFLNSYQVQAKNKAVLEAENRAEIEAVESHNREIQARISADQGIEQNGFYKDGIYQGTGQGYGGSIETELTVENGFVTAIKVISSKDEDPVYMDQASRLIGKMLDAQSNDVDTVSGATFSSIGLIESVGDALGKAV